MQPASLTLKPCLSPKALSTHPELVPYLLEFKKTISAPSDIYNELYVTTLQNLMAFCQDLPLSAQTYKSYSLLKQQFKLTLTALKLLRGRRLPPHSDSETIAEQEPMWAYAVFTISLFTQLQRIQHNYTVALFKHSGDKLGDWHPLTGNLYEENTFYTLEAKSPKVLVDDRLLRTALISRIIPAIAMRWMASCPSVFTVWWQTLIEDTAARTILTELLSQAAKKIQYIFYDGIGSQLKKSEPEINASGVFADLVAWLNEQYNNASFDQIFLVDAGLFIGIKRLADFLAAYPGYESTEKILQWLNDFLITYENKAIHRYRATHFEKRLVVDGIMLNTSLLPSAFPQLPKQNFIPDIPL